MQMQKVHCTKVSGEEQQWNRRACGNICVYTQRTFRLRSTSVRAFVSCRSSLRRRWHLLQCLPPTACIHRLHEYSHRTAYINFIPTHFIHYNVNDMKNVLSETDKKFTILTWVLQNLYYIINTKYLLPMNSNIVADLCTVLTKLQKKRQQTSFSIKCGNPTQAASFYAVCNVLSDWAASAAARGEGLSTPLFHCSSPKDTCNVYKCNAS